MSKRNWNTSDFTRNTRLDGAIYSKIIRNKPVNATLRTITAFCVGIGASRETAEKLIAAAGLALKQSKDSYAYHFVISHMNENSFDECNMFLERLGVVARLMKSNFFTC